MNLQYWHSPKRQKGVVAVEAALALPIVIMVMLLIFEGSRLIFTYNTVSHAASEGVRYAAARGNESEMDININEYIKQRIQYLSDMEATIDWPSVGDDDKAAGQTVTVTVTYVFESTFQFVPGMTLSSQSRAIIPL